MKSSPALPITVLTLRVLIFLNWILGAAILAGLASSFFRERWMFQALGVAVSAETLPLLRGMRLIAVLGLVAVPLDYAVLRWLLAIVETVQRGDPFVAPNARRLHSIAKSLLALQLLSLTIDAVAGWVSTPAHPLHVKAGFSPGGWVAVLLAFVLAQVFAHGTSLREDMEGTV